ncbi:MAG: xanthine dehydrogenase family protein subunit M [Hyphomicrobiales bacterium]|nr:xanthine dehydrogenase family protein subunit M [Hyphomicrobiales bacterium]
MGYNVPNSLTDALAFLAQSDVKIIAGGTDLVPSLGDQAAKVNLLDVSRLTELRTIRHDKTGWRIGAAARWTEVLKADLPTCFDGLKLAAREIGSRQIQNSGTVAGNLCNASPAADGVPPLLALNAQVELSSVNGVRMLPLADFITGVREIDLRGNEIVTAVFVPHHPQNAHGHFLKLGARKYLVISIAMVSSLVWKDSQQRIAGAHVAVGSCSAIALRLPGLEAALLGMTYDELAKDTRIWGEHLDVLSPISDIRGSGEFRLDVAQELCKRSVLASLKSIGFSNG